MRTVSYRIGDLNKAVIHIGRVAENEYTRVQIDAGEIFAEYPNAIATLAVQPPEGYAYPATVTREGNLVIWDVKDVDLAAEGKGEIQLTFTEDNVVVKSCIGRIQVCRSIVGDGEAPEPLLDWLTEATQVLGDLEGLGDIAAGATDADIGKALSPKTVEDGVVTEWQYTDAVGKPFTIKKTFSSVSAMLSYTGTDIEEHEFALINSTDADNGKLFQYEPNKNLLDLTTLKAPAFAGQTYSYSLTATWDGVGQVIYIWHDGGTSGEAISMIPKPRSGQSITTTGTTTAEAGCTGFTFSFPSGVEVTAGSVTAKWIYVGNLSTSMTVPIDDTAGSGVTNKVWSANKTTTELSGKADKTDTVLATTLSRGRKANTTVGSGSFAFGNNVESSGQYAHAEGEQTAAKAQASHAEGQYTTVSTNANFGHAEGQQTQALGPAAHAEGSNTQAKGHSSHAEGSNTIANAEYSHVLGKYNIGDSYDNWDEWAANTSYTVGNKVKRTDDLGGGVVIIEGLVCKTDNNDSTFNRNHWTSRGEEMNYAEIVGNGTADNARSNARTLDWDGNEELAGDLTIKKGTADEVSVSELKSAVNGMTVEETLLRDELPGTTTAVTLDSNGNPTSIVHSADGTTVRTDAFVWSTGSVTETRTASDKYITITTNLETLAQTISEIQEVA